MLLFTVNAINLCTYTGGHLVTLFGLNADYWLENGLTEEDEASLKGIIGVSGVYNVGRLYKSVIYRNWYVYPAFGTKKELLREASPLTHVRKTPFGFLFINAGWDFHLPRDTEELVHELKKLGVKCEAHTVPWTNHESVISTMNRSRDQTTPLVVDFIRKSLFSK